MQIHLLNKVWQESKKQIEADRAILFLNGGTVLVLLVLSVYAKFFGKGQGIEFLFADPFSIRRPYYGLLTSVSEVLWCLSGTVCLFSFTLLNTIYPNRKANLFVLCSAIGIFVLLADDLFRITLILRDVARIPKGVMYLVYGTGAIAYGLCFWRKLLSTPYVLLIVASILFGISGLVDTLHIQGHGAPVMLEDGTKLLGILNIAFYFWHVCRQEIIKRKYGIS
ncbi:hypothetical protein [Coleofasciculus sp. FACHB-1120]|uniref:hypothetical protein n=1 Tax=Coleofasciculus sp. FACHB-1120 TaxID=2692783 RepID=UPI00168950EE|nr:hypothetical protein [Coleofasciculus sp. FACHB-1120]MBD2744097.1 hypothetical protein [Coleofasciculus sp. FACHB-1120]